MGKPTKSNLIEQVLSPRKTKQSKLARQLRFDALLRRARLHGGFLFDAEMQEVKLLAYELGIPITIKRAVLVDEWNETVMENHLKKKRNRDKLTKQSR